MARIEFVNGWSAEFDDEDNAITGTARGKNIELVREVDGRRQTLFWWTYEDFKEKLPVIRSENGRELRLDEDATRVWTVPGERRYSIELEELTTDGRWIVTSRWY